MAEYIFEGEYKNKTGLVKVRLFLVHFEDEHNIHIIYSPHLDLSGYGANLDEAKKSFVLATHQHYRLHTKKEHNW